MAVLSECPFCHRRQSIRSKKCSSKKGKGCGADLEKARRSGKVKYWIAYRIPGGKQRFEKMTGEKATSLEYAKDADAKRKVQKRENRIFDIKPEAQMTFQELTDWYLSLEKIKALASFSSLNIYLKKFNSQFGNVIVSQIKRADLENLQAKRKAEGMADGTIDQEIGHARAVIYKAFENDLVGGDTLKVFKIKRLLKPGSNNRKKIITLEQFREVMDRLPFYAAPVFATAFFTGMRRGEIMGLTWPKVDMKNRIIRLEGPDTKNGKSREIPICEDLFQTLRGIPRAIHDDHVFLFRGRPIGDIRYLLKKACQEVGIEYGRNLPDGFTFHGCRHTFNTNMRRAGVSQSVIMEITGHSSLDMFQRYNTVDGDDIKKAIGLFGSFLASVDQNVDQRRN